MTDGIVSAQGFTTLHLAVAGGVVAVLLWQLYRWQVAPIPSWRRWALTMFRVGWMGLLLWCLFDPMREWTWTTTHEHHPTASVVVDCSASMALTGDAQPEAGTDRWQTVLSAKDRLARRLADAGIDEIGWFASGSRLRPWTDGQAASDPASHLVADVATTIRTHTKPGRPHLVFVISDGADTDQTAGDGLASALGSETGAACYPILVPGLTDPPPLARVERLDPPTNAVIRTRIDIPVQIRVRQPRSSAIGTAFQVTLDVDGQEIARHEIPAIDDGITTARFSIDTGDRPGLRILRARLLDDAGQERSALGTGLVVLDEHPCRVLWLQGGLDWEYRFVRQALSTNPSLAMDALIHLGNRAWLHQDAEGKLHKIGAPRNLVERLGDYQVVVLANLQPAMLDDTLQQALVQAVRNRGIGVLFATGDAAIASAFHGTRLEQLLPVELEDIRASAVTSDAAARDFLAQVGGDMRSEESRFVDRTLQRQAGEGGALSDLKAIRLTTAGIRSPLWKRAEGDGDSALAAPPATFRFSAKARRAKPAATVLAVHPSESGADGQRPLLAVQEIDAGRAGFLGTDALWRWRMQTPTTARDYDRVWQQLLLWLGARTVSDRMDCDRSDVRPGEPLKITLRSGIPSESLRLSTASVPAGDSTSHDVPLTWDPEHRTAIATITAPEADTLELTAWRGSLAIAQQTIPIRRESLEQEYCQLDRPRLDAMAKATNGQVLRADDLDVITTLAKPTSVVLERTERRSLWHEPWIFIALLAAFVGELLLRRWFQLS